MQKILNKLRNERRKIDNLVENLNGDENASRTEGIGSRMSKSRDIYSVETEEMDDGGEFQVGNNDDRFAKESSNLTQSSYVDDQIPDSITTDHNVNVPLFNYPIGTQAEGPARKQLEIIPSVGEIHMIPSSPIPDTRQVGPLLQTTMISRRVPAEQHCNRYAAQGLNRLVVHEEMRNLTHLDSVNWEKITK